VTAVATAWGTAAQATPSQQATTFPLHRSVRSDVWQTKVSGLDRSAAGRTAYFVQLAGQGAVDAGSIGAGRTAPAKVLAQRATIGATADRAFSAARSADAHAVKLYTTTNLVPGFAVQTDRAGVEALAQRSDVVKVSRIATHYATNANTANLVKALQTWKFAGDTGKGVTIGVIDTGLDYTHADFGGKGTAAAYDTALAHDSQSGWRAGLPALAKAKIVGGYDLVGDAYYPNPTVNGVANPKYQPIPRPDRNPLDCNEHGTHVAGTAAGYGVKRGGKTFTGKYSTLDPQKLLNMRVGPGMAPAARLYSLKVFGCEGGTDVVIAALDRAMDPNQDGNTHDAFDMINMSLGLDDAPADDPENLVVAQLARHGVLPVIAMGNGGDETDIGGSPGNATASLAVASTVDSYQQRDGLKVNAPASVAGIAAGQFSIAYDWATKPPVTGDVVKVPTSGAFDAPSPTNDTDGCNALSDAQKAAVAGKVAWLYWDDNDATRRCGSATRSNNVAAAGAIGAIFTSSLDVFGAGITGNALIPVIQLPKAQTDRLTPAVDAGTLNVTFDGSLKSSIKDITPSITDTLSSFSSRGTHGSIGVVKPDVAAPGDTIASAGMGTGNNVLVISGTSMATPLVAGVSALVKSRHPDWTPLQVKAAVMNTATHDVWSGPSHSGHRYAPARVGSGRVDARAAVRTTSLAYVKGPDNPVSASFGVVPALIDGGVVTRHRTLVIRNLGAQRTSYRLGFDLVNPSPGVAYSVSRRTVGVPAHGKTTVTVTLKVTPSALRHRIDPTEPALEIGLPRQFVSDASGHLTVTPRGKSALRVPVYAAAKPVSHTTATATAGAIQLTGAGVDQGTGSEAYRSAAAVMQYGVGSPPQPECNPSLRADCWTNASDRSGDIRYTGAATGTVFGDQYLWFGISTRQNWATTNTMTPYVDVDTGGSAAPDIELVVENFATAQGRTDVLLVDTFDLHTGDLLDTEPVNFNLGDVDTNVFDTNVVMLPVDLTWIATHGGPDLTGADAPISYSAHTFNGFTGADQDATDDATFNVGQPGISTPEPLYQDQGGVTIPVTGSGDALVFHLHGANGHRDQVVNVPAP
jgi:subtilisin family serine protease